MPNSLSPQLFSHPTFGDIRTIVKNDEPWFVAKDVSDILGFEDAAQITRWLESDEQTTVLKMQGSINFSGLRKDTKLVTESGLYSLIFRSRKPEAKRFKKWVTAEILPSIRKHGGYLTPEKLQEALLTPDTLIQLATNLKDEQEKRQAAEALVAKATEQIEADRPKVLFADSIETSIDTILVGDLAKLIQQATGFQIGQQRLFAWLRENGFLHKSGSNYNLPTQRSMDLKVFVVKETTHTTPTGTRITRTPKVTGKGQTYFINKFAQIQQNSMTQAAMLQFSQGGRYVQQ